MPHAPDLSGCALDGRYELHAVIGEGTFGRVYRGRDRRLARPVAVKVIKPWWAEDPDWVRSFEREAQLLARVNDPGIVQIFDVGHAREGLYYVAELVEGESLADRLRRGPLPPGEARRIAEQLCRALTGAHSQRVVHRDVKPANVLIATDGRVKVGDFGIARLAESSTDGAGATIVGTPRYMAPEQARGRPTSPATDVYSVGVVLYEMLAGRPPFTEKAAVELALRHLNDPPPPLPVRTPPMLEEIVGRALAKDPADRYPSAAAMAAALARARGAGTASNGNAARRAGVEPDRVAPPRRARPAPRERPAAPVPAASRSVERSIAARAAVAGAAGAPEAGANGAHAANGTAAAGTASTALLDRGSARADGAATRVLPERAVARPPAPPHRRRRRRALLLWAGLSVVGALAAATVIILSVQGHASVPDVHGWRRAGIASRLRRLGLVPSFHSRYSGAPKGTAITQTPPAGTPATDGSTVRVVLSAGPRPVPLPQLVGKPGGQALALLAKLRLHGTLTAVPAPGFATGEVTHETPAAGLSLLPGATVKLSVAEAPRWRPLTSFSGDAGGESVVFRILGQRWRLVYSMSYQGMCALIIFCSGPSAQVFHPGGTSLTGFDLGTGSAQTRVFELGPGLYQVRVAPGSDSAAWSIEVEDYY
jgi:serine/threonine-protein kinase